MSTLAASRVVAGHALREALRRRVFLVVLGLTLAFGALYAWAVQEVFEGLTPFDGNGILDAQALAGATMLGLSMFGTLFLGVVLAVFLALNAVRGDAERGLLQPIVVRPIGRPAYLLGRWLAAATVSAAYVICCFAGAVVITGQVGGFWPDSVVVPALDLAGAVALVAGITLLGSIFLGTTANGIAVLMVFGAGLLAGLLGSIGDALRSDTLTDVADVASWLLPFEGLYRDALHSLVASSATGITGQIVQLGPLGGSADSGPAFFVWAVAYAVVLAVGAVTLFGRRDL